MVTDSTPVQHQKFASPAAGFTGSGEYTPAGEGQGEHSAFSADQVAHAFDVEVERVHHAMQGELGLGADDQVDSRQAQALAEALLTDRSIELRTAALMNLGAYTPRTDHDTGAGETAPGEESDRLERRGVESDEERG